MHPYDPNQQQPQHYPPQPPPVFVQQPSNKAATIGIWVLVAWIVGPFLLLVLCCAGCFALGGIGALTGGDKPDISVSPGP